MSPGFTSLEEPGFLIIASPVRRVEVGAPLYLDVLRHADVHVDRFAEFAQRFQQFLALLRVADVEHADLDESFTPRKHDDVGTDLQLSRCGSSRIPQKNVRTSRAWAYRIHVRAVQEVGTDVIELGTRRT